MWEPGGEGMDMGSRSAGRSHWRTDGSYPIGLLRKKGLRRPAGLDKYSPRNLAASFHKRMAQDIKFFLCGRVFMFFRRKSVIISVCFFWQHFHHRAFLAIPPPAIQCSCFQFLYQHSSRELAAFHADIVLFKLTNPLDT